MNQDESEQFKALQSAYRIALESLRRIKDLTQHLEPGDKVSILSDFIEQRLHMLDRLQEKPSDGH